MCGSEGVAGLGRTQRPIYWLQQIARSFRSASWRSGRIALLSCRHYLISLRGLMSAPLNILGQHMVRPIIDDQLWKTIEPLVPPKGRHAWYPGKRSVDERAALTGILFVLMSGIPWEMLPVEMGCGSGTSCRQQFRLWQRTGAWEKLREILAEHPQFVGRIDWSRVTSNWSG